MFHTSVCFLSMVYLKLTPENGELSCKCSKFRLKIPKLHQLYLYQLILSCKERKKFPPLLMCYAERPATNHWRPQSVLCGVAATFPTVCSKHAVSVLVSPWSHGREKSCLFASNLWQEKKYFPLKTMLLELWHGLYISCIILSSISMETGVLLFNHFMLSLC